MLNFDGRQRLYSPEHFFSEVQKEPEEMDPFTRGPLLGTPDSLVCGTQPASLLHIFNFQRLP